MEMLSMQNIIFKNAVVVWVKEIRNQKDFKRISYVEFLKLINFLWNPFKSQKKTF